MADNGRLLQLKKNCNGANRLYNSYIWIGITIWQLFSQKYIHAREKNL